MNRQGTTPTVAMSDRSPRLRGFGSAPLSGSAALRVAATHVLNHYEVNEEAQLIVAVDQGMPTGDNHKKQ